MRLDYKFDDKWFSYEINAEELTDAIIGFAGTKMVNLSAKSSDLLHFFDLVFGDEFDDDDYWEDICDSPTEFGRWVHSLYEEDAREAFEEEQLLDEE